jgi:EXS family
VAVNSGYSFWWDVTNDWGLSLFQSFTGYDSSVSPQRPLLSRIQRPDPSTPSLPSSQSEVEASVAMLGDISHPPVSRPTQQQPYPWGLRPVLLFNDPIVYYIAISLNLVLRLTWSLKLSSHLHSMAELEGGVFLVETLELIRRWVWVFFRIEWEAVKKGVGTVVEDGPTREEHELDGPWRQQK